MKHSCRVKLPYFRTPAGKAARPSAAVLLLSVILMSSGCAPEPFGARVFFCDGAGWYSSTPSVKDGFRRAKVPAQVDTYSWSTFLGPGTDHLLAARNSAVAAGLARKIEEARAADPERPIFVMGLSAGTAVALSAIEQLEQGVTVDAVALLSPSVSARRDLTKVMPRVRYGLFATCSRKDAILSGMVVNADGGSGPPAGINGFSLAKYGRRAEAAYRRVYNLPWRSAYVEHDWDGGHVSVTNARFIANVIIPRLTAQWQHPLDRSVAQNAQIRRSAEATELEHE